MFQLAVVAGEVSYSDLVKRLYDLEHLATPPLPGEKCSSWTSTDRAALFNERTGGYENWSANRDGTGFIRREGSGIVAAEMKGPGVIWRVWSAKAEKGHIKIYIDGGSEPVLDMSFEDYFDNTKTPFNHPELVHIKAKGKNNFVPIPYAKSCKVLLEEGWGRYYQITYTTFGEGTRVPSFRGAFNAEEAAALAKANAVLARRGTNPKGLHPTEKVQGKTIRVGPGETAELFNVKGPRAITEIRVFPELQNVTSVANMLRELAISISWDGESSPSVWSPLGDFFGTAPGANHYRSLPLGMTDLGWYSFWYMPFATSALGEITNDGKWPYTVKFVISHRALTRPANQLLRFHAKWHRDTFLIKDKNRWPDWPLLITKGKGRFCGVHLHVWNPKWIRHGYEGAKPGNYWWGEGDEKFFVDGEKYPSTFGTGSEDYFGFAWATPDHYDSAFQNQILNENNSNGHISMSRFQIADNVPFQRSFEAVIEKYYPNEWNGNCTLYDTIVYWYQEAGAQDIYKPVPVSQRVGYYVRPTGSALKRSAGER
jgi:hypothetical protein